MIAQSQLFVSAPMYGVACLQRPPSRHAEHGLPTRLMPSAEARPQLVARWHRTKDDRLEMRWLYETGRLQP
jgi:hypothetical protein